MAKCDEGYLCEVCGADVASIADSNLYLQFVIGMLDPEVLHTAKERHISCNPILAQYIVVEEFDPVIVEGPFDKRTLDKEYVCQQELLVSRGWKRLKQVAESKTESETPIIDYPLPEVVAKIKARSLGGG